jgi:hypothetical protein
MFEYCPRVKFPIDYLPHSQRLANQRLRKFITGFPSRLKEINETLEAMHGVELTVSAQKKSIVNQFSRPAHLPALSEFAMSVSRVI